MPEPLTTEQAAAIAQVVSTADGHCTSCASDLADELTAIWPEHPWKQLVADAYDRYWQDD